MYRKKSIVFVCLLFAVFFVHGFSYAQNQSMKEPCEKGWGVWIAQWSAGWWTCTNNAWACPNWGTWNAQFHECEWAKTPDQPTQVNAAFCKSQWLLFYSKPPDFPPQCLSAKGVCEADWDVYISDGSCIQPSAFCENTFNKTTSPDSFDKCVKDFTQCMDGWWSSARCSCKAIWGIVLSTNVPFIGNCISMHRSLNPGPNTTEVTPTTAFPLLIGWATKIIMAITLVFCFIAIVIGGVRMSMGGADEAQYTEGKSMIMHVVIALALMWASGVILRLINPNFFT